MSSVAIPVSPDYQRLVYTNIANIVIFILCYITLLLLAVGATLLCAIGSLYMLLYLRNLLVLIFCLSLIGIGVLVLIYLVKFIFYQHIPDRTDLHEITQEDEPGLFEMIRELAAVVNTSFPRRIYLSYGINAYVFYNSSFWSLFFPVRKNLAIGMGLVNSLTESELKAVLAHELGHFSQRSMRLGSYVYYVNRVIHNLIYENDGYERILNSFSSIHAFANGAAHIAAMIVKGLQRLLQKLHGLILKSYMALSREMEFHADSVSAYTVGVSPAAQALTRLPLAEQAFELVGNFYGAHIANNMRSPNLYENHRQMMGFLAEVNHFQMQGDLPMVTLQDLTRYTRSRLVVKDQWASHPTLSERLQHLATIVHTATIPAERPANALFQQVNRWHQLFTDQVFQQVNFPGTPENISYVSFLDTVRAEYDQHQYPAIFQGYYDAHLPVQLNLSEVVPAPAHSLETLFGDENLDKLRTIAALEQDLATLGYIADGQLQVNTFDYDGVKYEAKAAGTTQERIRAELEALREEVRQHDQAILSFFYNLELTTGVSPRLLSMYQALHDVLTASQDHYDTLGQLQQSLQFVHQTTPYEEIEARFRELKPLEQRFKNNLKTLLLPDSPYQAVMTPEIQKQFELYLSKTWTYFFVDVYHEDILKILLQAVEQYAEVLGQTIAHYKRVLLVYQASLAAPAQAD
ncbi:MAG: M48 family metallopeptidase [Bacteroidia bacterium]|nr:M48 family metallopeptidase [Bacteroidia bacterium]